MHSGIGLEYMLYAVSNSFDSLLVTNLPRYQIVHVVTQTFLDHSPRREASYLAGNLHTYDAIRTYTITTRSVHRSYGPVKRNETR